MDSEISEHITYLTLMGHSFAGGVSPMSTCQNIVIKRRKNEISKETV